MSDKSDDENVNPEEFLRALLQISPEDAKSVRDDATEKAEAKTDDQ